MKLEDIKVGLRVRSTVVDDYSCNQIGTLMDAKPPLLWVKFDDAKYNNMLVPAKDLCVDEATYCTACHYKSLEVVTE